MSLLPDDPDISIVAAFDRVAEHITGDTRLQQRIRTAGRVIAQWIEAGQKESLGETTSMGVDLLALFRLLDDVFTRVRGLEGQVLHALQELNAKGDLIKTLNQEARARDQRIEALATTLQALTTHPEPPATTSLALVTHPEPLFVPESLSERVHRLSQIAQALMDTPMLLETLQQRVEALEARTVSGEDQA